MSDAERLNCYEACLTQIESADLNFASAGGFWQACRQVEQLINDAELWDSCKV